MGQEQFYHKAHVMITWLSDHALAVFVAAWLLVPQVKEVLGLLGAVGAVILIVGRNYGMWLDNKVSRLRLKQIEEGRDHGDT